MDSVTVDRYRYGSKKNSFTVTEMDFFDLQISTIRFIINSVSTPTGFFLDLDMVRNFGTEATKVYLATPAKKLRKLMN